MPCRGISRLALWTLILIFAFAGLSVVPHASGQAPLIDREYVLKAAYLYKFASYVRWPDRAFDRATSPFVFGVLGPDSVGPHLRRIAAAKEIDGRKIEVRNFAQAGEVHDCHILFMPRALDQTMQERAIQHLSGRNVLFVGETKEFLRQGGIIDLIVRENRVHLYISKPAYEREGLKVSAQLLRVATVLD